MKLKNHAPVVLSYILILSIFIAVTIWCSTATDVVAQLIPMERKHTIIIDPGHGGEDGGATSCTGMLESTFNLDIALKLNDLFHLLGYDTVMVRTSDISVYTEGETIAAKKVSDLKQRVKTVNGTENGILVSIHQNTFSDAQYSGAQVFYSKTGQSQALAAALQTKLIQTINPGSNRQPKKADGIYLLDQIERTGILLECGFLSNAEEEAKLRDHNYQKKLCCVITTSVGNFLDG